MARYKTIRSEVSKVEATNSEFEKIANCMENLLSRKGDNPNQMESLLDMNNQRIINIPEPTDDHEPVNFGKVKEIMSDAAQASFLSQQARDQAVLAARQSEDARDISVLASKSVSDNKDDAEAAAQEAEDMSIAARQYALQAKGSENSARDSRNTAQGAALSALGYRNDASVSAQEAQDAEVNVAADALQVSQDASQVQSDALQVAQDRAAVEPLVQEATDARDVVVPLAQQVATDAQQVSDDALQVSADAGQVSSDANQVALDRVQTGQDVIAASTSASEASDSEELAKRWAVHPTEVQPGLESSKTYSEAARLAADQAQSAAGSITGSLSYIGSFNAAPGNTPPEPSAGSAEYIISGQGTILGTEYYVGDVIIFNTSTGLWNKKGTYFGTAAGTSAQGNDARIINGQTSYDWGDHALAGYVKTDTNTTYTASTGMTLTGTAFSVKYGTASGTAAQGNDSRINNGQTAFGWGNHASAGYIKSYVNTTYTASTGLTLTGTAFSVKYGTAAGTAAQGNDSRINNGQAAYGWGNHAAQGYSKQTLVAGTNITISGSTISAVNTNTTYAAGGGLSLSGTTFAVDSTVARRNAANTFTSNMTINGKLTGGARDHTVAGIGQLLFCLTLTSTDRSFLNGNAGNRVSPGGDLRIANSGGGYASGDSNPNLPGSWACKGSVKGNSVATLWERVA